MSKCTALLAVILLIVLFSLPKVSAAGRLMSQAYAQKIFDKDRSLEGIVDRLFKYSFLYSKDELREAVAFTYEKFPPSLRGNIFEFVQRAMDTAAARKKPLDFTVCALVEAILDKPQGCPR